MVGLAGLLNLFSAEYSWSALGIWLVYLVFGLGLFAIGFFGAGDVKLVLALLLCIDQQLWHSFLLFIFISGGVWAVIFSVLVRFFHTQARLPGLPYAFPIALSALFFI